MSCSITGRFGFFSRGSRTPWSGFSFKSRRPSFVRSLVAQFSAVRRITRSDPLARAGVRLLGTWFLARKRRALLVQIFNHPQRETLFVERVLVGEQRLQQ